MMFAILSAAVSLSPPANVTASDYVVVHFWDLLLLHFSLHCCRSCTAARKIYPAILCNGFPVLSSSLTTVTKSEFIAQFAWCSSECHRNVTKVIALHSNPDSVGFPQYQALIKVQERKWGKTLCSKGIFFTMLTIKNAWDLGRSNSHQDQRPRPFYIF